MVCVCLSSYCSDFLSKYCEGGGEVVRERREGDDLGDGVPQLDGGEPLSSSIDTSKLYTNRFKYKTTCIHDNFVTTLC